MIWVTLLSALAGAYIGAVLGVWLGWRLMSWRRAEPWWPPEPFNWRLIWPGALYWNWYDRNVRVSAPPNG